MLARDLSDVVQMRVASEHIAPSLRRNVQPGQYCYLATLLSCNFAVVIQCSEKARRVDEPPDK